MGFYRTVLVAALFAASLHAVLSGQTGTGVANRPQFSSTEKILERLTAKNPRSRQEIAVGLGLQDPITRSTCTNFDSVETREETFLKGTSARIIVIRSDYCKLMFLVPVIHDGHLWTPLTPIALWTQFSEPSFRLEKFINADESEIVISNQTIDEGTGIAQRNMTIYKVVGHQVNILFDEPESVHFSVPDDRNPTNTTFSEDQTSTFEFLKNTDDDSSRLYIAEKRSTTTNGNSTTVYRTYRWDQSTMTFRGYAAAPFQKLIHE